MNIKYAKPAPGYVYSENLGEMVIKAFVYKGERFDWNEQDCLYYSEWPHNRWLEDIPVSPDSADMEIML